MRQPEPGHGPAQGFAEIGNLPTGRATRRHMCPCLMTCGNGGSAESGMSVRSLLKVATEERSAVHWLPNVPSFSYNFLDCLSFGRPRPLSQAGRFRFVMATAAGRPYGHVRCHRVSIIYYISSLACVQPEPDGPDRDQGESQWLVASHFTGCLSFFVWSASGSASRAVADGSHAYARGRVSVVRSGHRLKRL
jgi:hypothetical protein